MHHPGYLSGLSRCVILLAAIAPARCATGDPVRAAAEAVYMPLGVERLAADGRFSNLANLPDGRVFNWFVEGKNLGNAAAIQDPGIPQKAFGRFSADGRKAPEAEGICYLRVHLTVEKTDSAGMMFESLSVKLLPRD